MVSIDFGGPQWDPVEKAMGVQSREFSWERLREELVDRADDRMNIAQMAIDRPAATLPDKLAARFVDRHSASKSPQPTIAISRDWVRRSCTSGGGSELCQGGD